MRGLTDERTPANSSPQKWLYCDFSKNQLEPGIYYRFKPNQGAIDSLLIQQNDTDVVAYMFQMTVRMDGHPVNGWGLYQAAKSCRFRFLNAKLKLIFVAPAQTVARGKYETVQKVSLLAAEKPEDFDDIVSLVEQWVVVFDIQGMDPPFWI